MTMGHPGVNNQLTHLNSEGDARAVCAVLPTSSPQRTQTRGGGAGVVNPKWFPCVSDSLFSRKPLVQCISHNLCLSSLVPRLTSTNRLTLRAYVHMAALIVILHGGAL